MSFPNMPRDINPNIDLPIDQIVNLLLASIAFEELGLAHIINAEAEKIQFVLGTLPNQSVNTEPPTIDKLIEIDETVDKILKDVIKKEMILEFKLENVLKISTSTSTTSTTTTTTTTTTSTTTTTTTTTAYRYLSGRGEGDFIPPIPGVFVPRLNNFSISDPIIQDPHNLGQSGDRLRFRVWNTAITPVSTGTFTADLTQPTTTISCSGDNTLIIRGSGTYTEVQRGSPLYYISVNVDFVYTFVMNTAPTNDQAGLDLYSPGTIDLIFSTNGTHDLNGSISFTCPIP